MSTVLRDAGAAKDPEVHRRSGHWPGAATRSAEGSVGSADAEKADLKVGLY